MFNIGIPHKIILQKYYKINYLGQVIQCSIEFPGNTTPEVNKIDMTSPDPNQRNITLSIKICTNYPIINERTEIPTDKVIIAYGMDIPVLLCYLDFKNKVVCLDREFKYSGNIDDDLKQVKLYYKDIPAKYPEKFGTGL